MAEGGGGPSTFRRSPSLDVVVNPLTPPLERTSASGTRSSMTSGATSLNPRGSHSLSRLGPGMPAPSSAALQRFATYSPRHDMFPSPPPSPITLRSLRVRDDAAAAPLRAALRDEELALTAANAVSPHHPHHPVRKRLSQRLAAWSKNFKAKFKKSGSSPTDPTNRSAGSSPSSSTKLPPDVAGALKQELLMDRVVASDGRSCTLTRRHQLSSDLPALLRSSSTSPRSNQHQPIHGDLSSPRSRTGSAGRRPEIGAVAPQTTAGVENHRSVLPISSDSRTPVGIVQSSAFIVTTSAASSSSSLPGGSAGKMATSLVVDSSSCSPRLEMIPDAMTASTRSEGYELFDRRRRRPPPGAAGFPAGATTEVDDADVVDIERRDDDVDDVDDELRLPPPELPPRRRRVQSTDNILDLPSDRSLSSTSPITTSLTTDDVASLRDSSAGGGGGASRSSSDVFAKSIERLKECGWYWGPLSWEEASIILKDKLDGSFLVRDSSDDRYILSLSIRCNGRTLHTRIQHYKGLFSFWQQPWTHGCDTIVDFIERCMMHSRDGSFMYFLRPAGMANMAPMPLLLLHPVSRLFKVPSLHHLSRFAILKIVRRDNVADLPLPPRLVNYLLEPQYLFEDLISGGEADDDDDDDDDVEEPLLAPLVGRQRIDAAINETPTSGSR